MSGKCEACRVFSHTRTRFDFKLPCCRAYFLVRQPSKAVRNGWMAYWLGIYGEQAAADTRRATIELWEVVHGPSA